MNKITPFVSFVNYCQVIFRLEANARAETLLYFGRRNSEQYHVGCIDYYLSNIGLPSRKYSRVGQIDAYIGRLLKTEFFYYACKELNKVTDSHTRNSIKDV